ncbi:MAG: hypothetical protein QXU97_03885 [Fervidicoccaceae archaeon]
MRGDGARRTLLGSVISNKANHNKIATSSSEKPSAARSAPSSRNGPPSVASA